MQGLPFVLLFTALTFFAWGAYGPLLRYGTNAMGHDGLKAFVGVGLAYFVIAVIVPFWILQTKGEKGKWTFVGTTYSIVAGSVGAIGALGIILALVFRGDPVFVMPLVFGFAPIVNTLVTAWMGGNLNKIRPVFVGGIIAAATGASGVLYFKPSAKPRVEVAQVSTETERSKNGDKETALNPDKSIAPNLGSAGEPGKVDKPFAPDPEPTPTPTPTPTAIPLTPIEVKPLFAARPEDGKPPEPDKPLVATRPIDGQPPVPEKASVAEKAVSSLVAALPADGQPPAPEIEVAAPGKAAPVVPTNDSSVPPPVVNPDNEPLEEATTKPGDKPKEPTVEPKKDATQEPAPAPKVDAAPAKELPPPVPNPEDDLSQYMRRIGSRFVSIADIQGTEPIARTEPNDNHEPAAQEKPSADKEAQPTVTEHKSEESNSGMIALSILMAALCWGSYGPMLHQGQMKMGGSRLRPFACVGIAYFIIAVAVPLVLLYTTPALSHGAWTVKGLFWSVVAGAAGAIGALGIILAFNAGGKPIYVMPLVFGFAPVINTFISLTEAGAWSKVETMFWVSLGVVIAGAITVLTTAPKAAHGPAHAPAPAGRS